MSYGQFANRFAGETDDARTEIDNAVNEAISRGQNILQSELFKNNRAFAEAQDMREKLEGMGLGLVEGQKAYKVAREAFTKRFGKKESVESETPADSGGSEGAGSEVGEAGEGAEGAAEPGGEAEPEEAAEPGAVDAGGPEGEAAEIAPPTAPAAATFENLFTEPESDLSTLSPLRLEESGIPMENPRFSDNELTDSTFTSDYNLWRANDNDLWGTDLTNTTEMTDNLASYTRRGLEVVRDGVRAVRGQLGSMADGYSMANTMDAVGDSVAQGVQAVGGRLGSVADGLQTVGGKVGATVADGAEMVGERVLPAVGTGLAGYEAGDDISKTLGASKKASMGIGIGVGAVEGLATLAVPEAAPFILGADLLGDTLFDMFKKHKDKAPKPPPQAPLPVNPLQQGNIALPSLTTSAQ